MVKQKHHPDSTAMDRTFAALADPTRRAILARLAEGVGSEGIRVTDLAAPFLEADSGTSGGGGMSLPAVSKHLRVLERAGLLTQEKNGRVRRCQLDPQPLQAAHDWVAFYRRFWTQRLDALADYLEAPPTAPTSTAPAPPTRPRPKPSPASSPTKRPPSVKRKP